MAMVESVSLTFWRLQVCLGHVKEMVGMKPGMIWTATVQLDFPIF